MTPEDIAATSSAVQALASVAALVVAGVAVWIAAQAKSAEKAQADVADKALRASRRQTALSAVPFLGVDHPEPIWQVDYPYLKVTYKNGGSTAAYAIQASVMGAVGKGQDDQATRERSGVLPALLPGDKHTTHIPIRSLRRDEFSNAFRYPSLTVVIEHRSPLGAFVRATYDLNATPEHDDEVWSLRCVEVDPMDGDEYLRFCVD